MNIFQFRKFYLASNYHLVDNISIIISNLDNKELFLVLWLVPHGKPFVTYLNKINVFIKEG